LPTFIDFGFRPLSNSHLRRTLARGVTVRQACRLMGVNEASFLDALNQAPEEIATGRGISLSVVEPPTKGGCSCCEDRLLPASVRTT
jgi:hypothetical protein